jgi:gluconolactonase
LANGPKRTLIDFGKENGPDGMMVDAAGHVYVACRSLAKPGVMVLEPSGRQIAFLPTGPEHQQGQFDDWVGIPSNMEFGVGPDAHSLYVTMGKGLYRIQTTQRGLEPAWAVDRLHGDGTHREAKPASK